MESSTNLMKRVNNRSITFTDLKSNLEFMKECRVDLVLDSKDIGVLTPAALQTPYIEDAITSAGVGMSAREWELTPHAFRQWCAKFNVPSKFLAKLADWGEGIEYNQLSMDIMRTHMKVEDKRILLRGLMHDDQYVCRAVLSPSYSFIENYDVLTAVFEGLKNCREEHGIGFEPGEASISDTHMRARINMPQLKTVSEALLRDYVSPFSGQRGTDNPVVFMGIEVRNSEVGSGSFTLVPSVIVEVCNNGMTLTEDIFRKVHLGSAMESGEVSQRTMQATMELITAQTIDKVREIANPEFLEAKVRELEGLKVDMKPTVVQTYLQGAFDIEVADSIFNDFITGGDTTAFGVAQAITSASQRGNISTGLAMDLDDSALEHAAILAG
jgi:hypothetical protein